MPTITLKNIPDSLYSKVKKRAKKNKRSINSEILYVLENSDKTEGQDKKKILESIRLLRATLPKIKNIKEIDDFKKSGRP
ncbi:MAG: Arc family DNA-binding protein [Ignavibacteriales bacterium]|nr:MAG: Arc family DNA-binding protein [Ignavibacteriales bacterium]